MTYRTRIFKTGSRRCYLHFSSGKVVVLKGKDYQEFSDKVCEIEYSGYLRGARTKTTKEIKDMVKARKEGRIVL